VVDGVAKMVRERLVAVKPVVAKYAYVINQARY
jgi:hypothetical protein